VAPYMRTMIPTGVRLSRQRYWAVWTWAMPTPDVERRASRDGGGTLSDRLGDVQNILHLRHCVRSCRHLVSQRTYTPLGQEYGAIVVWPVEAT
jgi:hypothetical protein